MGVHIAISSLQCLRYPVISVFSFRGAFMIDKDLLDNFLRCPHDPTRSARLEEEGDGLVCQRCRLKYPIKNGIPDMLVEDAILPPGASSLQSLPCQQTTVAAGAKK